MCGFFDICDRYDYRLYTGSTAAVRVYTLTGKRRGRRKRNKDRCQILLSSLTVPQFLSPSFHFPSPSVPFLLLTTAIGTALTNACTGDNLWFKVDPAYTDVRSSLTLFLLSFPLPFLPFSSFCCLLLYASLSFSSRLFPFLPVTPYPFPFPSLPSPPSSCYI